MEQHCKAPEVLVMPMQTLEQEVQTVFDLLGEMFDRVDEQLADAVNALFGGDFKDQVKEQPGSASVVQGVASDRFAIGYSGIGYRTADVAAVPLAEDDGDEMVPATPKFAYTGDYPLSRFLYVYVNRRPGGELDPLRREFVKYVFSQQGQRNVVKDGYFPITAEIAKEALARVGIKLDSNDVALAR